MKLFQPLLLALSLASLALLGSCNNATPSSAPTTTPAKTIAKTDAKTDAEPPKASSTPSMAKPEAKNNKPNQGGQVVEAGAYHLELLMVKEENNIHLDFFLQAGDTHAAIPDAKVTAQVQFPDGSQKSYELAYDAPNQHYATNLPTNASGEYKIVILSDIKGEKVNGRFNFKL